ncbi:MAG: lipoate--protein ligase family protein [Rothia sp. (in: high G+C Gram-positive bacteria)]|nr:lipoate--protein ligase family protein [Rothia sp. (in: high G+C Gram-positive bacteria)]
MTKTQTYHGERKIVNGKLVVVDVETDGQVITSAKVSGDFFIEPEEAFFELAPALVGASVDEDAEALVKRLKAALGRFEPELALHGFSLEDIAFIVRRALTGAKEFTDYEWTILRPGVLPTAMNVALDEYLLEEVLSGRRGPIVRFWDWDDRATVIGSFQSYTNELWPEGVQKHGVQVVRRISGGGAMFMEGGNCVTYSIYAPKELVAGLSYEKSYEFLDQWVLAALAELGVHAWYKPINDITSDAGKIGGAAQKRNTRGLLHHVTMSYDIDADKMLEVLRIGQAKIVDKGIRSAKKRVDPLRRQTGASREDIVQTMIKTFTSRYGGTVGELSPADLAAAQKLVDEKFGTDEWTHRVP